MKLHQDCNECDECEASAEAYALEHPEADTVTWSRNGLEGEPKHSAKIIPLI